MMTMTRKNGGFTLVEMAVVLVIVGLMLGGLIGPISAQMEQRSYLETRQRLGEIKEALLGFAILNGRLPCPSTTVDPASALFGVEDATCPLAGATTDGYLPWKTLGVTATDAWGSGQTSATAGMVGYWRYRIDRNFAVAFNMTTSFSVDALKVQDSVGNSLTTTERPVAIVYSTGKNRSPDGANASYEAATGVYESDAQSPAFDDVVMWLGRPLLMNRMVAAGKLP